MILVYDGACGLCRTCLALVLVVDRARRVTPLTLDEAATRGLAAGMSDERWRASWHAVDAEGGLRSGGAALVPLLRELGLGPPAALAGRAPGVVERAYRALAERRGRLGRWIPGGVLRWADRTIADRASPSARAPARSSGVAG